MNLSLIILDSKLGIRRFTPAAQALYGLIPSDIGRPISDIRQKLTLPGLEEKTRAVIESGTPKEEEVQDQEGRWYSLQVRPYTTPEKQIDGAVIALTDISILMKRNAELQQAFAQLQRETAEREQAEQQLHEVQRRLLEAAISKERQALARDIHDGLSQVLAGVVVQLEAADQLIPAGQEDLRHHLAKSRDTARQGLEHVRRSAWAWRKGDSVKEGELPGALERLGHQLFDGTPSSFHFSGQAGRRSLPAPMATNLLMVAQEALANTLLHSGAKEVWVELIGQKDLCCLVVRDNGKGFDLATAHKGSGFGLISMDERTQQMGGELLIKTQPGEGTRLEVRVPIPKQPSR